MHQRLSNLRGQVFDNSAVLVYNTSRISQSFVDSSLLSQGGAPGPNVIHTAISTRLEFLQRKEL